MNAEVRIIQAHLSDARAALASAADIAARGTHYTADRTKARRAINNALAAITEAIGAANGEYDLEIRDADRRGR